MTSPSKIRVCGTKVRTGCITCKKRRVKCDEQKPVCRHCSKGGRDCSYIAVAPPKPTGELAFINYTTPRVHRTLAFRPGEGHREQRALVYFRQRVGPSFGSPFDSEFFTDHLLFLADHDTSVRAALVALGSMHEEIISTENASASEYTLQHYSKAIRGVVDLRTASNPQAMEIALTTCILFACLESLRGHNHSCFSHWTAGLEVLQEQQSMLGVKTPSIIPMDVIRTLYARIDSQLIEIGGSQFGNGVSLFKDTEPTFPDVFKSLKDAMLSLELLYNRLERFLATCERVSNTEGATKASLAPLYEARSLYQHDHHQWCEAFARMPPPGSILAANTDTELALLAVKLLNHVVTLILSVDILDAELDFDFCLPIFQQIVVDAEAFLELQPSQHLHTQPPTDPSRTTAPIPTTASKRFVYTLSQAVVLPLYFTAARCRHSPTRHRALALLKSCRRREGLWDSSQAAAVAERIVLMEEMSGVGVPASDDISREVGVHTGLEYAGDDAETRQVQPRVKSVKIDWVDGEGGSRAEFSLQAGGLQGLGAAAAGESFGFDGAGVAVVEGVGQTGGGESGIPRRRGEHVWGEGDDGDAETREPPCGRFRGMAFTELVRL